MRDSRDKATDFTDLKLFQVIRVPNRNRPMKFLIIRFSSIGDIVLTSPVVRCLKKQLPDAEIHFLIKPKFRAVMEHNPYIDKIHVLQDDWDQMITELKAEKFDQVIDLHHNLRTLRVKKD